MLSSHEKEPSLKTKCSGGQSTDFFVTSAHDHHQPTGQYTSLSQSSSIQFINHIQLIFFFDDQV